MAASVDRKDNAQGYNKHNIQLVCKWINLGRGQHSTDEMLAALMAHRDPAAYIEVIRQAGNPPPPKALMRSPVLNAEMQQLLDELSQ